MRRGHYRSEVARQRLGGLDVDADASQRSGSRGDRNGEFIVMRDRADDARRPDRISRWASQNGGIRATQSPKQLVRRPAACSGGGARPWFARSDRSVFRRQEVLFVSGPDKTAAGDETGRRQTGQCVLDGVL